jgi:NADH dehydrogenase
MFGPDDAFLTTILRLLRQLPIYPMFGRGLTRLQPAYVEDVAEAISRIMQRAETPSLIFEFGGPRVYSYEEFLRSVASLVSRTKSSWHFRRWLANCKHRSVRLI